MIELGDDMSKIKRKIKIKGKGFFLLILLFLFVFLSFHKFLFSEPNEKTSLKSKKDNDVEKTDERLVKLDNIHKKIDFFNMDYIDRYFNYKDKNSNLSTEQVIKNVNMNLDQPFYDFRIPAKINQQELILVNKYYYLESDYIPENLEAISNRFALSDMRLVKVAKEAFEALAKKAKEDGFSIVAMSSYRSYDYQVNLYNRYVKSDGKEAADTYSGRPGHSEHQTGFAVDVYNGKTPYTDFESTKEYEWMQKHAHEFGFILRFPKGKEDETGYQFESWHYRYVGVDAASYIHKNNISFEEYYATILKDWS